MSFNARSIVNKLNNFQSYVYSVDFQIVALTETWLTESIFNNEILPTGYNIYRQDCGSRGGGVMLAVKDSLPSKLLPSPGNLEIVTVSVNTSSNCSLCHLPTPKFNARIYATYF